MRNIKTDHRHQLSSYSLLLFLGTMIDNGIAASTIVFYFTSVGGSLSIFGWMAALNILVRATTSQSWERLGARIGIRRAVLLSSFGLVVSSVILFKSSSVLGLVVSRALSSLFSGYALLINAACLNRALPHRRLKDLSFLGAAQNLGGLCIGPLLGAYLWSQSHPHNPYLLVPVLALVNLALTFFLFPEKEAAMTAKIAKNAPSGHEKDLMTAGAAMLLFGFAICARDLYFPVLLKSTLQLSWIQIGYVLALGGLIATLLPVFIVPKVERWLSTTWPILIGFAAILCSQLMLTLSSSAPRLFLYLLPLEMSFFGLSLAITMPSITTLLSFSLVDAARASIHGKLRSWSFLGKLIASPVAAVLYERFSHPAPFGLSVLIASVGATLVLKHPWPRNRHKMNQAEIDAMLIDWSGNTS